ncbi:uncharacterized protein LOC62_01G001062 [Vanrija pseudolonga]|uniref:Uncharacterized protein n=1 Tax=Vanrija pseudolonga TaxID=143232 RepID=A0AAF0Y659_9TREE|nr:hypothetical protein LOC62_01G001062 [Vanrija pseudolonga]
MHPLAVALVALLLAHPAAAQSYYYAPPSLPGWQIALIAVVVVLVLIGAGTAIARAASPRPLAPRSSLPVVQVYHTDGVHSVRAPAYPANPFPEGQGQYPVVPPPPPEHHASFHSHHPPPPPSADTGPPISDASTAPPPAYTPTTAAS